MYNHYLVVILKDPPVVFAKGSKSFVGISSL